MKNVLFAVSGPSGVGKGTLVKLLVEEDPALALSISCTTRAPRAGEVDGREYFFLSKEEFFARKERGEFLEYDEHFGNFYGTPKPFVLKQLQEKSVILEIDVMGAQNARETMKNDVPVVLIMVVPPDLKTLQKRLAGRKSESGSEQENRLERVKFELEQQSKYDYVVINDDLNEAKKALQKIIDLETNRTERR